MGDFRLFLKNGLFFIAFLTIVGSLLYIYDNNILIVNANESYGRIYYDWVHVCYLIFGFLLIFLIYPKKIKKPSDFFLMIYIMVVILSNLLFNQISGKVKELDEIYLALILFGPIISVLLFRKIKIKIRLLSIFNMKFVYYFFVFLLIISVVIGYLKGGVSGGFDLDSIYDRRLLGRDFLPQGSISAYIIGGSTNGFAPFLAFIGIVKNKKHLVVISFLFALFMFWLLGLKSPIASTSLFSCFAILARKKKFEYIPVFFLILLFTITSFSIVEIVFFDHDFISQILVRRIFTVQGAIMSHHYDLITAVSSNDISQFFFGVDLGTYPDVNYLVGERYMGNSLTNANTNAFLYSFSKSGLVGYLICITFIGIFFSLLDLIYQNTKEYDVYFVGIAYSLLITEQAYTTALITSGFALITLLICVSKRSIQEEHLPNSVIA
jgi:hypothetical protein